MEEGRLASCSGNALASADKVKALSGRSQGSCSAVVMVGVKSSALHPPELWELAGTCPALPRQLSELSWREGGEGELGSVCGPVAPWVPSRSGEVLLQ